MQWRQLPETDFKYKAAIDPRSNMRTFGLALRALPLLLEKTVEQAIEDAIGEWRSWKSRDARAIEKGFSIKRGRNETYNGARLVEYLADQSADSEGRWRTSVRFFQQGNEPAWVTLEMALEEIAERFAPALFTVQPPRLLRSLGRRLQLKSIDGWDVPRTSLEVGDSSAVDELATEILDTNRRIPLVVVTEPVYVKPMVADLARPLAEYVLGLARVVHVGPKLTFALSARLGKELSVFDGGVRIYWPGVDLEAPPQRHPLVLRHAIEQAGANARRWVLGTIAEKLIPVTTARYREPQPIRDLLQRLDTQQLEEAQLSHMELAAKLEDALRSRKEAQELEQAAYADIRKLELDKNDLEGMLLEARHKSERFRALYEGMRRKAEARGEVVPPAPADEDEAIEQARKTFAETLVLPNDMFIDTDLGSDVYDALNAMHDAVLCERSCEMGDRRKVFSDLFGKHLNHPAGYEPGPTGLSYNGEDVCHRVHIKSGKPDDTESIYWLQKGPADRRQYVIVRIGRHA